MTDMTDIEKHRQTLAKALAEGVKTAQKETQFFRVALQHTLDQAKRKRIAADIQVMDDWVVELLDALEWLNGEELAQMEVIYEAARLSK